MRTRNPNLHYDVTLKLDNTLEEADQEANGGF